VGVCLLRVCLLFVCRGGHLDICSVIEFNVGNIVTDLVTLLHSCQPLLILDLHLFSRSGWFSVVVEFC
jgi:hypothetical protein